MEFFFYREECRKAYCAACPGWRGGRPALLSSRDRADAQPPSVGPASLTAARQSAALASEIQHLTYKPRTMSGPPSSSPIDTELFGFSTAGDLHSTRNSRPVLRSAICIDRTCHLIAVVIPFLSLWGWLSECYGRKWCGIRNTFRANTYLL